LARQKLTNWLRDKMVEQQFWTEMKFGATNVLAAVATSAKLRPKQVVLEDVTRQKLTYRKLMVGVDLFAQQWRHVLGREKRTGVLLPNANAMPVTLLSLWAVEKVPAILNYSTGPAIMLSCIQLAEVKQII